jgi:DNA-binding HxlR family transcriptional regulator
MSFQDLRHTLRDFEGRGWIRCLNEGEQTGRIYVQSGRCIPEVDWFLIARLSRAYNRARVLHEIAAHTAREGVGRSASALRRNLRGTTKMALGHILRALAFLDTEGLVECTGITRKRGLRCYRATPLGMKMSEVLAEMNRTDS